MSSIQDRCDWLREHLTYEVLMVRHAYEQLRATPKTVRDQLAWNASFGAFSLYARNLYSFLTNKTASGNFGAADYDRPAADGKLLEGIMATLNQQVFHTGKQRRDDDRKVGLEKAAKVYAWIDANLNYFIDGLREPYKPAWDPDRADPSKLDAEAPLDDSKIAKDDPASSLPFTSGVTKSS
jgi:hypothetical protein